VPAKIAVLCGTLFREKIKKKPLLKKTVEDAFVNHISGGKGKSIKLSFHTRSKATWGKIANQDGPATTSDSLRIVGEEGVRMKEHSITRFKSRTGGTMKMSVTFTC